MGGIGPPELLIVLLILLVLFGATKLPKLARSIGQSANEFKAGLKEGYKDEPLEGPCPFCDAEVKEDTKFCPSCGKSADEIRAERAKSPKSA
jgi:sec-independent protein translocase protein TatA